MPTFSLLYGRLHQECNLPRNVCSRYGSFKVFDVFRSEHECRECF